MDRDNELKSIVVMGVSGSGKSTISQALATRFDASYIDADWLHSSTNIAKMSDGHALTDEDRWPWLHAVGQRMAAEEANNRRSVVACSALKRAYRDVLRHYVPTMFTVFLDGPASLLQSRIDERRDGFFASSLLASQFEILEPLQDDELGLRVDIEMSCDEMVEHIDDALRRSGRA